MLLVARDADAGSCCSKLLHTAQRCSADVSAGAAAAQQLADAAQGSATCRSLTCDMGDMASVERLAATVASSYDQQVH